MSENKFTCDLCEKRSTCTRLCKQAERYVNQDNINQRESWLNRRAITQYKSYANGTGTKDYKEVIHSRSRRIDAAKRLTKQHRRVIALHVARVPVKEIAEQEHISGKMVYYILSKYK